MPRSGRRVKLTGLVKQCRETQTEQTSPPAQMEVQKIQDCQYFH